MGFHTQFSTALVPARPLVIKLRWMLAGFPSTPLARPPIWGIDKDLGLLEDPVA